MLFRSIPKQHWQDEQIAYCSNDEDYPLTSWHEHIGPFQWRTGYCCDNVSDCYVGNLVDQWVRVQHGNTVQCRPVARCYIRWRHHSQSVFLIEYFYVSTPACFALSVCQRPINVVTLPQSSVMGFIEIAAWMRLYLILIAHRYVVPDSAASEVASLRGVSPSAISETAWWPCVYLSEWRALWQCTQKVGIAVEADVIWWCGTRPPNGTLS